MISPIAWIPSATWLVLLLTAWRFRGGQVRQARREADAMRYQVADLEASRAKISRELAEHVRSEIQQSQYDEYTAFVPKMQALSKFMNREFPADMKQAQLHRPPLHVFEIVQNLLIEHHGKSHPRAGAGKVSA